MKDLVIPLLIAVIGLAATGLGTIVGARAARFGAEKNAETVRRQVRDQGAVEHGHWLRQQRLNTYESFLEAWDECLRITQASGNVHDPDLASLDVLQRAAGRMAERARRIALLGPEEVTRAADELAETMQKDVEVSKQLIVRIQDTIEVMRPISVEATDETVQEIERSTEQLSELMHTTRDQGDDPNVLDGHPLLGHALESFEQHQQVSEVALQALTENLERMSATVREAEAALSVLTRNREARERSREVFTSAVRNALGTPPMPQLD